jgi:hypothetical protein
VAQTEKKKKNRLPYMILSLIIAMIIWALVAYATDIDINKTVHNVGVTFVGEDVLKEKGFIPVGVQPDSDFSVKLNGKRRDIIDTIDNISIEVDVSNIIGSGVYDIEGSVKTSNRWLTVMKTNFKTIPVQIEEYVEKEIPVHVTQVGNYKNKLVKSEVQPATITISGAKSEIDAVASGKVIVDLAKFDTAETITASVVPVDESGEVLKTKTLESASAQVTIKNTTYEYAVLPVKAELGDNLKDDFVLDYANTEINPQEVKIGVTEGKEFSDVKAEINEYTDSETEYTLIEEDGMYIPDEVSKVMIKPVLMPDPHMHNFGMEGE